MCDRQLNPSHPKWFQLSESIRITSIDKVSVTNVHPSRTLPEWALVLVTSGERTFRAYDEDYAIHSNEFFLLPANTPHSGVKLDRHQAYFVHFAAEGKAVPPPVRIASDKILLPMYGKIPMDLHCIDCMEYAVRHRTPPFYSDSFMESQVRAILYQMSLHMQKSILWTRQENAQASEILKFIDDNLDRRICEQDYSQAFGKSYRQLNNVFGRIYGTTIKQMQLNLRINRAKLLLSTGYSIASASAACGFEDYLYFLRTFKAKTGLTPSEYIQHFYFGEGC